jgi:hypothetical protein
VCQVKMIFDIPTENIKNGIFSSGGQNSTNYTVVVEHSIVILVPAKEISDVCCHPKVRY